MTACLLRRARVAVVFGSVCLVAAACSGGESDEVAEPNDYSRVLLSVMEEDDQFFDDGEAECLSVAMIDALGGPERFRDAGVEPEQLRDADGYADLGFEASDEERAELARAFGTCGISLAEPLLAGMGIDDLSEEAKACVADALDEEALSELFASSFVDPAVAEDRDAFLEILRPAFECIEGPTG